jgi:hypothetical protein
VSLSRLFEKTESNELTAETSCFLLLVCWTAAPTDFLDASVDVRSAVTSVCQLGQSVVSRQLHDE